MMNAPDKTLIGRISKGFDFLAYHLDYKAAQKNRLYERAIFEQAIEPGFEEAQAEMAPLACRTHGHV